MQLQASAANNVSVSASSINIKKRSGNLEKFDVAKLSQIVHRAADGLSGVDANRVIERVVNGLHEGAATTDLSQLLINNAAMLIADDPNYDKLATRFLNSYINKEVHKQGIMSFKDSVEHSHKAGILSSTTFEFVLTHQDELNKTISYGRSEFFGYFGLRTVYDRYLLKHPKTRLSLELPQYFFMRVACGLAQTVEEAIEFYEIISSLRYLPGTPTLFNSGTRHPQMSSCYLLDSPADDLESIYSRYTDIAKLSRYSGGIGIPFHRVRSEGSLITSTNGHSAGIIPFIKTLDASVAAVSQANKRKGACCVYLESWHADIEAFLELRENTGDTNRRTYNLNIANWVPDLFMERVEKDDNWSLFDPKEVPTLPDLYGGDFNSAYVHAEELGLAKKVVKARDLYYKMMRALAQTGNGWMNFKDACNLKSNQTSSTSGYVIHSSNLCTEICEVTDDSQTAVCNLGSINLAEFVVADWFDYTALGDTVRKVVKYLDRVIDINHYPTSTAKNSNSKWRPIGLGVMGLQDVFFQLRLAFDSEAAIKLSRTIQSAIYYNALYASCELSKAHGPHDNFRLTKAAQGELQFDLWNVVPEYEEMEPWDELKEQIKLHGLRNSLLIAIAPTATIASIAGCYECIEPQVSNLFKRETLSGDFLQINTYLVTELKARNLWTDAVKNQIKLANGSIQNIQEIPEDIRNIYRTAWELSQKTLIDHAAARGPFVDQSMSLSFFMETPTIGKLSSLYMAAWKAGIKTSYYIRSRPATEITKATLKIEDVKTDPVVAGYVMADETSGSTTIACSLESPGVCEACQ